MSQQLDLGLGKRARDEAIERVAATPEWFARAERAVRALVQLGHPFTTDEVWGLGLPKPREPRALGKTMQSLAKSRVIRRTGKYRPSKQPENHARPIAVWVRS